MGVWFRKNDKGWHEPVGCQEKKCGRQAEVCCSRDVPENVTEALVRFETVQYFYCTKHAEQAGFCCQCGLDLAAHKMHVPAGCGRED